MLWKKLNAKVLMIRRDGRIESFILFWVILMCRYKKIDIGNNEAIFFNRNNFGLYGLLSLLNE